jgi:multidrug transporter EmrE-like cation transporter
MARSLVKRPGYSRFSLYQALLFANAANISGSFNGEDEMNAVRMFAIALIVAGGLGLAYGSFTYTEEMHQTRIGPVELSIKDTETVNIPVWAGVGAVAAGVILLLVRK